MQIPTQEVLATSEVVNFKLHVGRGCFLNGGALSRAESHLRTGSAGHGWPGRALGGQPGQGHLPDRFTGSIGLREMSHNLKSRQSPFSTQGDCRSPPSPLKADVCFSSQSLQHPSLSACGGGPGR